MNCSEHGELQSELMQDVRLKTGIDPDEHTIYNVLCPQIRSKWSKQVEHKRRVIKSRNFVEVLVLKDPKNSERRLSHVGATTS